MPDRSIDRPTDVQPNLLNFQTTTSKIQNSPYPKTLCAFCTTISSAASDFHRTNCGDTQHLISNQPNQPQNFTSFLISSASASSGGDAKVLVNRISLHPTSNQPYPRKPKTSFKAPSLHCNVVTLLCCCIFLSSLRFVANSVRSWKEVLAAAS